MHLRLGRTLWLLFTVFVVYGSTIPFHFVQRLSSVEGKLERLADNPFRPKGTPQDWSAPDMAQNFLLFVPFGFLGVLAAAPDAAPGLRRVAVVSALGAALACGVEASQLFTRDRTSSLTDALTNTAGAAFGAVLAHQLRHTAHATLNYFAAHWLSVRSAYPVLIATGMVCALAWVPFDVTLDIGMILPKLNALNQNIWQYTGLTDEGGAIIQFALLAAAVSAWLSDLDQPWPAAKAAAIVTAGALGLEASQVFITSRMPGLEDAAVRVAGTWLGASLWTVGRRAPHPILWLTVLLIATTVAAAIQSSGAPEILATRRLYRVLNLRNYEGTAVPDFIYLIERMCIYFPMGFVVAGWPRSTARVLAAATLMAAIIAVTVELGPTQPFRWRVGLVDIAISMTGAALGAWAARIGAVWFNRLITPRPTAGMGD